MKLEKGVDGYYTGAVLIDEMEADFIYKSLEFASENLAMCPEHLQMMEEMSHQFDILSDQLLNRPRKTLDASLN
tara:strand:+ start:1334 stop:1555 length:222 start_codon:yes stop_codon:yes gene_type:complete